MLGSLISRALSTIGITDTRVSRWVGAPCGCKERQEKLDAVTYWAIRVIQGKVESAEEYLDNIMEQPDES
jgi:hypothetical protein